MCERTQAALYDHCAVALSIHEHDRIIAIAVILDLSAKYFLGALQRLAALPPPDGDWITGLAHRPRTPIARNQQCVLINPRHVLLAAWQHKTVRDKITRFQIHLAQRLRVFAPGGELDKT